MPLDSKTAFLAETRIGFAATSRRSHCIIRDDLSRLTDNDRKQVELFSRFLSGERSHEIVAWALGEPMTSANDPDSCGMGC